MPLWQNLRECLYFLSEALFSNAQLYVEIYNIRNLCYVKV